MALRKLAPCLLITVLLVNRGSAQSARTYDTNDWIPITNTCPTCYDQQPAEQKQPTARVLNLAEPDRRQAAFFPKDDDVFSYRNNEQYLREISVPKPQPKVPRIASKIQRVPTNLRPPSHGEPVFNQPFPTQQQPYQQPLPRPNQIVLQTQGVPSQLMLPPPGNAYTPQGHQFYSVVQTPEGLRLYQPNYQTLPPNVKAAGFKNNITYEVLSQEVPNVKQVVQGTRQDAAYKNYDHIDLTSSTAGPQTSKETVQLLYVPIESLNQKQQVRNQQLPARHQLIDTQQQLPKQHAIDNQNGYLQVQQKQKHVNNQNNYEHLIQKLQPVNSQGAYLQQEVSGEIEYPELPPQSTKYAQKQIDEKIQPPSQLGSHHKEQQLQSIQADFAKQALNALNLQFQLDNEDQYSYSQDTTSQSTTTKPAPKKRKPHQPPLAVYMGADGDVSVADVLEVLKGAQNISVHDAVGPNTPQVFVGPYNLEPPPGYAKFDLPYLNSLENNRVERKATQYPFFVAPLSYKAPLGYSKIALPAPHVGSVVVSHKEALHEKHPNPNPQYVTFDSYAYQQGPQLQPLNVYNTPVSPPKATTPRSPVTPRPDPLSQTINQYELEQINSQFLSQSQFDFRPGPEQYSFLPNEAFNPLAGISQQLPPVRHQPAPYVNLVSSTPTSLRFGTEPQQVSSTPAVKQPRPQQTTTTTERAAPQVKDNRDNRRPYTVLEEFSVKPQPPSNVQVTGVVSPLPTSTPSTLQPHILFSNQFSQNLNAPTAGGTQFIYGNLQPQYVFEPTPQVNGGLQIQSTPSQIKKVPYEVIPQNQQTAQTENDHNNAQYLKEEVITTQQPQITSNAAENSRLPSHPQFVREDHTESPTSETSSVRTQYNARLRNRGKSRFELSTEETTSEPVESTERFRLPLELPEINPSIPVLINDLQNQSLQQIHVSQAPILPSANYDIVPATKQHLESVTVESYSAQPAVPSPTTSTQAPTTETTTRRQRGRQRLRVTTEAPSTTRSATRRTVQRTRRPYTRTRQESERRYQSEQPTQLDEYSRITQGAAQENDYIKTTTQRTQTRQRFRTRGRPITEPTVATTTSTERYQNFRIAAKQPEPQSYMQFEQVETPRNVHRVPDTEQIIQDFHQVYSVPQDQSTEALPHNGNSNQGKMNVDILITHPVTETTNREVASDPRQQIHIGYNPEANVPAQQPQAEVSTNQPVVRKRVRTRGRARSTAAPSTSTTTTLTTTTTTTKKPATQPEGEELYGFFRRPNFQTPSPTRGETNEPAPVQQPSYATVIPENYQPNQQIILGQPTFQTLRPIQYLTNGPVQQHPKLYSAKYVSSTPLAQYYIENGQQVFQYEDQPTDNSEPIQVYTDGAQSITPPVKFLGEIRPKYSTLLQNKSTEEIPVAETTTTTTSSPQTTRGRIRIRLPIKTSEAEVPATQADHNNEVDKQYAADTTVNQKRGRSRGKVHFKVPESIKGSREDDDIEGENYPAYFLLGQQPVTQRPKFQITVVPGNEDHHDDDQVPHSSIYRPKIIAPDYDNPQWSSSNVNDIPVERKSLETHTHEQPVTVSMFEETSQPNMENDNQNTKIDEYDEKSVEYEETQEAVTATTEAREYETTETATVTTATPPETTAFYSTTTTTKNPKRRGFWRLVNQRPVDSFDVEAAESQYVGTIVSNDFSHEKNPFIKKSKYKTEEYVAVTEQPAQTTKYFEVSSPEITSTTTEQSLFSSFFNMFDNVKHENEVGQVDAIKNQKFEVEDNTVPTTETSDLKFGDEQERGTDDPPLEEIGAEDKSVLTTTSSPATSTSDVMWNIDNAIVKTSTSTEISHETEICYRGKCVKSSSVRFPQ